LGGEEKNKFSDWRNRTSRHTQNKTCQEQDQSGVGTWIENDM